jgi:hypothetical protein
LNPSATASSRDTERHSLDTSHFESDTTQLGGAAPKPAEQADEV